MDRRAAYHLVSVALTACWTSAPSPPVVVAQPRTISAGWIARVGGTIDVSSNAVAVALSPAGEVAVVFRTTREPFDELDELDDREVVEVARYTATGERLWLNAFASPACDNPMFGPVVRFTPDGAIIAGGMDRANVSPCLWRIERDGRIAWSHSLTALQGVPNFGIDATGRITATGLYQDDANIVGLAADGTQLYAHDVADPVDGLAVTMDGRVHTLRADDDMIEVASFSPGGAGRTIATVPAEQVASVGKGGRVMHIAAVDDATYIAWDSRIAGGEFATHVAEVRGSKVVFEHRTERSDVRGLAATANGYVVIGKQQRVAWFERGTSEGKFARVSLEPDGDDGRAAYVDDVAMTANAIALVGRAAKRMSLRSAGTITTDCRADPDSDSGRETCIEAGFVAVLP